MYNSTPCAVGLGTRSSLAGVPVHRVCLDCEANGHDSCVLKGLWAYDFKNPSPSLSDGAASSHSTWRGVSGTAPARGLSLCFSMLLQYKRRVSTPSDSIQLHLSSSSSSSSSASPPSFEKIFLSFLLVVPADSSCARETRYFSTSVMASLLSISAKLRPQATVERTFA